MTGLPLRVRPEGRSPGPVSKAGRKRLLTGAKEEHRLRAPRCGRSEAAKLGGRRTTETFLLIAQAAFLIADFPNVGSGGLARGSPEHQLTPLQEGFERSAVNWVVGDARWPEGPLQCEHLFLSSFVPTFSQSPCKAADPPQTFTGHRAGGLIGNKSLSPSGKKVAVPFPQRPPRVSVSAFPLVLSHAVGPRHQAVREDTVSGAGEVWWAG